MVTLNSNPCNKDAWISQIVGGTLKYGNGSTPKITVGAGVSASDPSTIFKNRGIFQIPLTDAATGAYIFNNLDSISAADLKLKVCNEECGVRGANQRIFVERLTGDFTTNSPSGNCTLSTTGKDSSHWPGPSATTVNRVLFTAAGPATDTVLTISILALMQEAFANGDTVFRFRLIAANAAGDGYDETNSARRISFYSAESSGGNTPYIVITGTSTSATAKTASLALGMNFVPSVSSPASFNVDGERGEAIFNQPNQTAYARLGSVSVQDIDTTLKFYINKIPRGDVAYIGILARFVDTSNHYRVIFRTDNSQIITGRLIKIVAGVTTTMQEIIDIGFVFLPFAVYNMRLSVKGISPTAVKAKIWREGLAEPGWMFSVNDSSAALQVASSIGLRFGVDAVTNLPITFFAEELTAVAS